MLRSVALVAAATAASCNMIDVIEKLKLPPVKCKHGCDDWTHRSSSFWKDGKVPADAGSYCAQPGAAVNSHLFGAWCYCKPEAEDVGAPPTPPSWDNLGSGACSAAKWGKQFGTTPPKGFAYDTSAAFKDAMYYTEKVTLDQCQDLCAYNLTNCDYISYVSTQQLCYVAEWCDKREYGAATTYHNGAQPVPPAPTQQEDWAYCVSPKGVPEQINLQVASSSSVVISFVTFEETAPTSPPVAVVNGTSYTGVTHVHKAPSGDRTYYMHFVLVKGLKAKTQYSYTVQSGGKHTVVSDAFTFRAPYQGGETKINIYGDMGIYEWNNMEWLEKDCLDGSADMIVHMGDHAYDEGEDDEHRADGYMSGFQPVLSKCPWMPSVGNHEIFEGEKLSRYLDSTWEKWGPLPTGSLAEEKKYSGRSTATSALGYLLSAGNHHGAGLHGSTPSQTSRYFSVDVGQAHLIALDLNSFFGCDPCGMPCMKAQMEWLKKDLAAANKNREQVPWVLVFSHFPLFCTDCQNKDSETDVEAAYYESDAGEKYGNRNRTAAKAWGRTAKALKMLKQMGYKKENNFKASSTASINYLEPVMMEYGVDMYLAGHMHYYESLWPLKTGNSSCPACARPVQKSFDSPKVTVHVTTGNGGPPGIDTFTEDCPGPDCGRIPATRKQTTDFGYGRLIVHNETHMTFQQRLNSNGTLFDEWTVYQPKHGPFGGQ